MSGDGSPPAGRSSSTEPHASSPFSFTAQQKGTGLQFGKAPVWGELTPLAASPDVPTSSEPPPSAATRVLEVKASLFGVPSLRISAGADSRVGHVLSDICRRLSLPDATGLTLVCAGRALSDPEERLGSVAEMGVLHCLKNSAASRRQLPFAAVEPVATCAVAPALTPPPAADEITVRFATGRELALPFVPSMTVMGLKRELEERGEGGAPTLRLFFAGRELIDALRLDCPGMPGRSCAVVTSGAVLMATLRETAADASVPAAATTGRVTSRYTGLRNQGATCYLNSLVQARRLRKE